MQRSNRNAEVRILRYVTEASFDGFTWGTVERKAQFIGQVMKGRLDAREVEDIGDSALTYQEVKALATGNPLLLDQAQAEAEVARLERLERAHEREQAELRRSIQDNGDAIERFGELLAATEAAIARRRDTPGDAFAMTVDGEPTTRRPAAEARLRAALSRLLADASMPDGQRTEVGSLGGFAVIAAAYRAMRAIPLLTLALADAPDSEVSPEADQLGEVAIVTRLENKLTGLDRLREETMQRIERLRGEVTRAEGLLGKPFSQADLLIAARVRARAIAAQLEDVAERSEKARAGQVEPAPSAEPEVADRREQRRAWARQAPAAAQPPPRLPLVGRPAPTAAP